MKEGIFMSNKYYYIIVVVKNDIVLVVFKISIKSTE